MRRIDMNEVTTTTGQPGTDLEVHALPEGFGEGHQSLAVAMQKAEIDQQISTAKAYPRVISRIVGNILSLATLDEETAKECIYALPRANKAIKGPSIRLAEIIASQWGNCRQAARVVHVDRFEKYVEAEGVFHDLESNSATTQRVRRRISDKNNKLLTEDMIIVTGNAACSIAKRNAILGGVPKAVWRQAYAHVERVIAGDIKTLGARREAAVKAFAAFGVKPEQVFAALQVEQVEDINLDHVVLMVGMYSALKSSESTVEEMFPRPAAAAGGAKGLSAGLDALATRSPPEGAGKAPAAKKAASAAKNAPADAKGEPVKHDPDTGEVKDEPKGGEATGATASEKQPEPSTDQDDDAQDDDSLLGRARQKATVGGGTWKRFKGGLTVEQAKELEPHLKVLDELAGKPALKGGPA
jgi:hypothetical protein